MALRIVTYTDKDGRKWRRGIPQGHSDAHAASGIPMGPPSLEDLKLPLAIEVRLHNALHDRELFELGDIRRRPDDVISAIVSTFKSDYHQIARIYAGEGAE